MKLSNEQLKQIIKEELEAVQQEGFMDSVKGMFGGSSPAMKGFNQGSKHKFSGTPEELNQRKEKFVEVDGPLVAIRNITKSLRNSRGTTENYFFGREVKSGMIDPEKIRLAIKKDLEGIDALGYTSRNKKGDLSFPDVIENPSRMADLVGDPHKGWQLIAQYISGKVSLDKIIKRKNAKDLFAVQQAYAAKQLG
jgi:hypothetical protein